MRLQNQALLHFESAFAKLIGGKKQLASTIYLCQYATRKFAYQQLGHLPWQSMGKLPLLQLWQIPKIPGTSLQQSENGWSPDTLVTEIILKFWKLSCEVIKLEIRQIY